MSDANNQKLVVYVSNVLNTTRYTIVAAILASIAGQLLMLYLGTIKVYEAFTIYLAKPSLTQMGLPDHLSHSDVAIALVIESLDAFLLGVVLAYFAYALFRLFVVPSPADPQLSDSDQTHMTLGKLKETLAQVIVVVLFILFARMVWLNLESLTWEILILPMSIALLALSIRLAKFK